MTINKTIEAARQMRGFLVAVALLAALPACSAGADTSCPSPDLGDGTRTPLGCKTDGQNSGGATGSGGATATGGASPYANFASVVQVAQVKCGGAGCHAGGEQKPVLLGIDNATLYSTLKTYTVKDCGNRLLVKPGAPQDSAFYLAQKGQCGNTIPQMPLGCSEETCTPADYLEGVRQWIANGAPQQ